MVDAGESPNRKKARPAKRTLVRWTDDIDKQVLLTVQYVCNAEGLRINWGKVAQILGPDFTEGAIVQHLAKLRTKMMDVGLEVPPPMRRGTLQTPSKVYSGGSSSLYAAGSGGRKRSHDAESQSTKTTPKGKAVKTRDSDSDDDLSDGSAGYGSAKKTLKSKSKKSPPKKRNLGVETPKSGDSFGDLEVKQENENEKIPRKATLRKSSFNKVDYAKLAGNDEADEDGEDAGGGRESDEEAYAESKFHDEDVESVLDQDESPLKKKAKTATGPTTDGFKIASGQEVSSPVVENKLAIAKAHASMIRNGDEVLADDFHGSMSFEIPYTGSPRGYGGVGLLGTTFHNENPFASYGQLHNPSFQPHYHHMPPPQYSTDQAMPNESFSSTDFSTSPSIDTPAMQADNVYGSRQDGLEPSYSNEYFDDQQSPWFGNMNLDDNLGNGNM